MGLRIKYRKTTDTSPHHEIYILVRETATKQINEKSNKIQIISAMKKTKQDKWKTIQSYVEEEALFWKGLSREDFLKRWHLNRDLNEKVPAI